MPGEVPLRVSRELRHRSSAPHRQVPGRPGQSGLCTCVLSDPLRSAPAAETVFGQLGPVRGAGTI